MIHIIKLGENKHRKLLVMKCYIIKIKTRKRSGGGKGKWGYSFTTVLLRFPKISSQNEGLVFSCKKRWEGSGNGTRAGVGRQPYILIEDALEGDLVSLGPFLSLPWLPGEVR